MKPITTVELLKLVSDTHNYDGSFAPQLRRAVAEVFRLRRKLAVMQANKPVQMNGGQTFTITQQFAEGVDPNKIALIFERDMVKLAEHRVEAKTTIPFERRNAVCSGPEPDVSASTTEGRTPDFEFPTPWTVIATSADDMKIAAIQAGISRLDLEIEEDRPGHCKVRSFNTKGLEWLLHESDKSFAREEPNPAGVQGGSGRPASDTLDEERR